LKPDTSYSFRLEENGPAFSFRTAPDTLTDGLIFAEGGDIGTDAQAVSALHRIAASWDPCFGFVGGDLAYANGTDTAKWVEYLKLWSQHMRGPRGNLIPMLVTIGNHEVVGSFGETPDQAPFFYSLFGGEDGKFQDGSFGTYDFGSYLRMVSLDSGHTRKVADQTEWLDAMLKEGQTFTYLFAAYHVPAYPSHRPLDGYVTRQIREHWVPLFDRYQVPVVFEHHDHTYKRTHPLLAGKVQDGGTVYIGDGAWGRNPREVYLEERPFLSEARGSLNVIKVELSRQRSSIEAYDEKGNRIDQTVITNGS
jgi:hypothetical protein